MLNYFHMIHGLYYTCWLRFWPGHTYKRNVERILLSNAYWWYVQDPYYRYLEETHFTSKLGHYLPFPCCSDWKKFLLKKPRGFGNRRLDRFDYWLRRYRQRRDEEMELEREEALEILRLRSIANAAQEILGSRLTREVWERVRHFVLH